jgi:hypothetical protein
MCRLVGIAVSIALLIGATDYALAAAGCPDGYSLQDGYCKPYRGPYGGYGYRDDYRYDYRYGDRDDHRYRHHYRRGKPCPEGFTVQDGVWKPYRGPYYR